MRAVVVSSLDGPGAALVGEYPEPEPGGTQALIDVHSAGLAYPDVLVTQGRYQISSALPFVLGTQLAGTVVSAPADAGLTAGDRVCAFTLRGAFAERAAVEVEQTFRLPDEVSWEAAAAAPTNYFTAHFVLRHRARLEPGESVLVHGGGGGVGLATVQVAKAFGARVLAVVSSPDKASAATDAGADETLPVDGFRDAARELTAGRGVDIVVDPVGGDRFTDSLRSLAPGGRLIVVGFVGGEIPTVKVNRLLLNNTAVIGAAWGEFAVTHPGYAHTQWAELGPLFASGALAPRVSAVLPMERAGEGLATLEGRTAVGNIVLQIKA